jgi:hypothetical protein
MICHYNQAMRSLHQCLLDTDVIRLQAIARFWDVELTAGRQRDIADQLAATMSTPKAVANAWDTLPEDQRQALEALLAAGGRMPLRVFERQWGEIRAMGPGRLERECPWRTPLSPAEGLWYTGFISRIFDHEAEETYEAIFIPPELLLYLPTSPTRFPVISLEPTSEPNVVRPAGDTLLDDACTLLAYLQNESVRPNSDGAWPAHHEARLIRRLRDPDPARLAFLHHLTRRLEWLRVTDSSLLRPDPGPVSDWLQFSTGQQRAALATAWRDDTTWNDLFHVPTLHPEETGAWSNDSLLARKAVLRHLKACAPNTWYTLDDLVAAIKRVDPDFQRPGGDYTTWYIRDVATGAYLSGFENWANVEGALIRHLVTGPLTWLGITDLGTDRCPATTSSHSSPPASFRLTNAGAAFLDLAELPPEPESALLILRPDFTVRAPPARPYERFQLARVADWVSFPLTNNAKENYFVYRLTPTSLERARRQGIPIARVLEFLGQVSGAGVSAPRFIETALTRWEARGCEARLERVLLLRLSSEELMAQIMSSPRTRRFIHEQVGPTVAWVHEHDWPGLIVALGEMGLMADVVSLD